MTKSELRKIITRYRNNFNALRSLCKGEMGVKLNRAGVAVCHTGVKRGITQKRIAQLLAVDPSTVSRRVR